MEFQVMFKGKVPIEAKDYEEAVNIFRLRIVCNQPILDFFEQNQIELVLDKAFNLSQI